jgi:hypothetical protein
MIRIHDLIVFPPKEFDKRYLVSQQWWDTWCDYVKFEIKEKLG